MEQCEGEELKPGDITGCELPLSYGNEWQLKTSNITNVKPQDVARF
jgi:hypothetical protein